MEYKKSFEQEYWNKRYMEGGDSGYGSYNEQLEKKLKWLSGLEYRSITEVGCGDFNFGKKLLDLKPVRYTGYDISDFVVARNKANHPHYVFEEYKGFILSGELLMCVDVLFHIIDDNEVDKLLQNLGDTWTKYLVLTAYERDEEMNNHVRIRKFDYKRFGEPILREVVEEDGQLYFYIFKK